LVFAPFSFVFLRALWLAVFDFQFWQLPDFGNSGDLFSPDPAFFPLSLQTKALPQIDPRVTLA
jgi:hypothetical protein